MTQRLRFRRTVLGVLVSDLRTTRQFRTGLPMNGVRRAPGVYEPAWCMGAGPAGSTTFEYGAEVHPGSPHVIWRRIGTHDILTGP
ncbi:hypothetical protein HFP43_32285 [Streptomyces sp. SJ1-7]|nr:hypothetical protein [Streptomyces sp. SJ1-7]